MPVTILELLLLIVLTISVVLLFLLTRKNVPFVLTPLVDRGHRLILVADRLSHADVVGLLEIGGLKVLVTFEAGGLMQTLMGDGALVVAHPLGEPKQDADAAAISLPVSNPAATIEAMQGYLKATGHRVTTEDLAEIDGKLSNNKLILMRTSLLTGVSLVIRRHVLHMGGLNRVPTPRRRI